MDHNCNVAIDSAGRYWEPWLSMWRTGSLLLVEPWDNAMRAFAERAQLLPRRMAALDLDADKLAGIKPSTVRELVERCTACESPEQCEWDLRQDAANPAWQAYCPNAATLMALASAPHAHRETDFGTPETKGPNPLQDGLRFPQRPRTGHYTRPKPRKIEGVPRRRGTRG